MKSNTKLIVISSVIIAVLFIGTQSLSLKNKQPHSYGEKGNITGTRIPSSPAFETPVNPITIPAQGMVSHDFEDSFKEEVGASNGEKPHLSPDQRQHRGNGSPTLDGKKKEAPKEVKEEPKPVKREENANFPLETTTEGITVADISKKPAKGKQVHVNNGPGPSRF